MPDISHDIIKKELTNINIIPTSQIIYHRTGIQKEFTHILSFLYQIYITAKNVNKIPSSLLIKHEIINHRIFFA